MTQQKVSGEAGAVHSAHPIGKRMDIALGPLLISPKYTSDNWRALSQDNPDNWQFASEIVRDRLEGRFLKFADNILHDPSSGFAVLAIDCLLAEAIQQFREGMTDGSGQSNRLIREFLSGPHFENEFDAKAGLAFYRDIRCGLLHQAEAKNMWLIRRKRSVMLEKTSDGARQGYILDVERFHTAVRLSLECYLSQIVESPEKELRKNLWTKMGDISNTRSMRGSLYG